jgi:hypothetical protein
MNMFHEITIVIDLAKIIAVGLDDWHTGVKMRKRLSQQLGRKVDDHELVSIRAWMSDKSISGKRG